MNKVLDCFPQLQKVVFFSARKVPIDDKRLVFCNGRIYWNSNMSHMFTQKLFQALFLCLHRAAVSKRIATPHLNECIDHLYYCRRDRSPALSIVENARYLRKSKRSIVCHALWPFPSIVLPCPFMSDLQYSNEWAPLHETKRLFFNYQG